MEVPLGADWLGEMTCASLTSHSPWTLFCYERNCLLALFS